MGQILTFIESKEKQREKKEYYKALNTFQAKCPVIVKDKEVYNKHGKLRYKYAPLEDIVSQTRKLLSECGFAYSILTNNVDALMIVTCCVYHIDGHSESTSMTIPIDPDAYMNAAQKVASAITYAKRYSFCNAFGILTGDEDDDANSTVGQKKQEIPEENKKVYREIYNLIKERRIFTEAEYQEDKENLDTILMDLPKLKEYLTTIKNEAKKRGFNPDVK